jgi:undecaprenyl-diphosphatase
VHIAAVFGMLVSIGLVYPRLKPFLYTFSVLAGVARICMGDYFPTDVLFGAFIGMVSADIVVALRKKLKNQ